MKTIFHTVQDRVWALLPSKLEEVSLVIEKRLLGEKLEFPEAALGPSGNRAIDGYEVVERVAVIPVFGILDKRMNLLLQFSGGTSTEILARDFQNALADPEVEAILLDVDSPGGAVDGTQDLADLIYAARGQKPVVAYANGLMASAAYWIGSAADQVVAGPTAMLGSIGVALTHFDYSGRDAMTGVKRTVISAGKYKRIASDEKPLSDEGQQYLQSMADTYYGLFLEAVAQNRGLLSSESVHDRMGDGRMFIGQKAVLAGLADRLGNFEIALALAQGSQGAQGAQGPINIKSEESMNFEEADKILSQKAENLASEKKIPLDKAVCEVFGDPANQELIRIWGRR